MNIWATTSGRWINSSWMSNRPLWLFLRCAIYPFWIKLYVWIINTIVTLINDCLCEQGVISAHLSSVLVEIIDAIHLIHRLMVILFEEARQNCITALQSFASILPKSNTRLDNHLFADVLKPAKSTISIATLNKNMLLQVIFACVCVYSTQKSKPPANIIYYYINLQTLRRPTSAHLIPSNISASTGGASVLIKIILCDSIRIMNQSLCEWIFS